MKVDKASYSPIFIALDTAIGAILSCSCCFSIGWRHWCIANFVPYDTVRLWWHFIVSYDSHSTIRMSLPKIIRVTAVFLLVLCLFAMIFMELFGLTKYGLETHEHSNFRDYGNALLLLIRVATGEAWVMVLSRDLIVMLYPHCFSCFRILLWWIRQCKLPIVLHQMITCWQIVDHQHGLTFCTIRFISCAHISFSTCLLL